MQGERIYMQATITGVLSLAYSPSIMTHCLGEDLIHYQDFILLRKYIHILSRESVLLY